MRAAQPAVQAPNVRSRPVALLTSGALGEADSAPRAHHPVAVQDPGEGPPAARERGRGVPGGRGVLEAGRSSEG